MEMKLICRLCAATDGDRQMLDIFKFLDSEFNLFDSISKHLGIWVAQDQSLPTIACICCVEKLQTFSHFHGQCQKTQELLAKMCFDPESQDDIPLSALLENIQTLDASVEVPNVKKESDEIVKHEEITHDDDLFTGLDFYNDDVSEQISDEVPFEKKKKLFRKNLVKRKIKLSHKRKLKREIVESSDEGDDGDEISKKSAMCLESYFKFICHICNTKCQNWHRLKAHVADKHHITPKVKCIICGLFLRSRSTIYRHVSNHNDPTIFTCDKCSRVTKSEDAMDRHKLKHVPKSESIFQCSKCPKAFSAKENLKSHERVHIPREERYIHPCEICGIKFTTKSAVAGHKRSVHLKLKRFMCDICGYSCSTSGELAQHRAIHSEDKCYTCPMCPKSFKTGSNLKAHLDTHATTSYQCKHCDKVLNSRRTLKKHLLVHEDVCRHICSFCNKAFKRRQTLKVHLTSHTGDTPIQCPWCTQKFAYSSAFRSHKQKNHPQEYALQQKLYQESLPKMSLKPEDMMLRDKRDDMYEHEMSLYEKKLYQEEKEVKSQADILIHKEEHMQQKNFENGFATLRKRHDITLIPKDDFDLKPSLFDK